ncbi:hypothetical protein PGB90_001202 [Kerria lacca]
MFLKFFESCLNCDIVSSYSKNLAVVAISSTTFTMASLNSKSKKKEKNKRKRRRW